MTKQELESKWELIKQPEEKCPACKDKRQHIKEEWAKFHPENYCWFKDVGRKNEI